MYLLTFPNTNYILLLLGGIGYVRDLVSYFFVLHVNVIAQNVVNKL